jgi:hypothetical protein
MAGSLFWDYKGGIDLNQPLGPGQNDKNMHRFHPC